MTARRTAQAALANVTSPESADEGSTRRRRARIPEPELAFHDGCVPVDGTDVVGYEAAVTRSRSKSPRKTTETGRETGREIVEDADMATFPLKAKTGSTQPSRSPSKPPAKNVIPSLSRYTQTDRQRSVSKSPSAFPDNSTKSGLRASPQKTVKPIARQARASPKKSAVVAKSPNNTEVGPNKKDPFDEEMPGKEVWYRNMAPYFPFGETPFMEKFMSDQINADLNKGIY